ncbi:MAG: hypothetical protein CVT64_03620 [Actinobacteria bacterium HGW-Actinobacteria-4]|nr:MAG: hypothetical protein CVT64_03620 [Actinobacteria bacterium HGW-Actinobacteria-4]
MTARPLKRDLRHDRRERRLAHVAGVAMVLVPIALIVIALWAITNWFTGTDHAPEPQAAAPAFEFTPPAAWVDATDEALREASSSRTEPVAAFWIADGSGSVAEAQAVASVTLVRALDRAVDDEASQTGTELLALWVDDLDAATTRNPQTFTTPAQYSGWWGGVDGTYEGQSMSIAVMVLTDGDVTARFAIQMSPEHAGQVLALREALDSFRFVERPQD